jgi:PIN domain nuclease of toxin-antitoxin system
VLDASALLAFVKDEAGADAVTSALAGQAVIGAVNLAEVVTKLADDGWTEAGARATIAACGTDTVSFDEETAYEAGLLRAATRHLGLSLGDRACLALARRLGAPVLTADRTWGNLDVGVKIEVIR